MRWLLLKDLQILRRSPLVVTLLVAYPVAIAKPLILIIEVPMLLTIALALGLLVTGPPERAVDTP